MKDENNGMLRNQWHEMGSFEVAREFFPDGKEAGLAIRLRKNMDGEGFQENGKAYLNCLGVQKLVNILIGETKYTGNYMLRKSDPHRFCPKDSSPKSVK